MLNLREAPYTSRPQPEHVLKTLRVFVHRTFGDNLSLWTEEFHIERTTCAMILSVYAVRSQMSGSSIHLYFLYGQLADMARSTRASSPIRPRTGAALLNLVRFATEDGARDLKTTIFTQPNQDLNAAQTVIYKWSIIVAWMWTIWDDERTLDYVIVERSVNESTP